SGRAVRGDQGDHRGLKIWYEGQKSIRSALEISRPKRCSRMRAAPSVVTRGWITSNSLSPFPVRITQPSCRRESRHSSSECQRNLMLICIEFASEPVNCSGFHTGEGVRSKLLYWVISIL